MTLSKEFLKNFSNVPVNHHFKYDLISRSSEEAVVSMEVLPDYLQEEGFVQGGIISAVADTAAVYTFYPDLDVNQTMTSVEFKMNFLRPALHKSTHWQCPPEVSDISGSASSGAMRKKFLFHNIWGSHPSQALHASGLC